MHGSRALPGRTQVAVRQAAAQSVDVRHSGERRRDFIRRYRLRLLDLLRDQQAGKNLPEPGPNELDVLL